MLADLDVLVIDLQDVGARYYTFIWTMLLCLEACAEQGKQVIVLDRPNPLGGDRTEGTVLDPEFRSFVGLAPIPMRHGLTIGELAGFFVAGCGLRPGSGSGLDGGLAAGHGLRGDRSALGAALAQHADAWTRPGSIPAAVCWKGPRCPRAAAPPGPSRSSARPTSIPNLWPAS